MRGEPAGGGPVQRGHLVRRGAAQFQLQQVGEHLVVAEPGPARVHRDHERVGLLQVLQHALAAAGPGQQVGELAVDPLQHRGSQQQQPHLLPLPVQHLGQQVLRHRPLTAGELLGEPLRIGVPGQRQRGQPQPGRPPLGPLVQQGQRRLSQFHPGSPQQFPRLPEREPQIGCAQLGQLPLQPQPVQPQPHVMPGGQHEPQLRRAAHHQQFQLAQRLVRVEFVHVVDHQPDPLLQRGQVFH